MARAHMQRALESRLQMYRERQREGADRSAPGNGS